MVGKLSSHVLSKYLQFLPLETVEYCFAYGSGVVAQARENTSDKMLDFIIATNNSHAFHIENIRHNPSHYSAIRYFGPQYITNFQKDTAARVFYNTHVKYENKLLKYGIIETSDLQKDLVDWSWLYLAGRLQKPVVDIVDPPLSISLAIKENRINALQIALLLLPDTFSLQQLFSKIVSISYMGDFRMFFGEDRNKVTKIVEGSMERFSDLYMPFLKVDKRVILKGLMVEQDLSPSSVYHRLQMLPCTVLERLQGSANKREAKQRDIEEVIFSLAHHFDPSKELEVAISSIVGPVTLRQTGKNAITAGFVRSVIYSVNKVEKMLSSMFI